MIGAWPIRPFHFYCNPTMTTVAIAAASLRNHGIRCRRDWGSAGRWLAEHGSTMYCVGGLTILEAAASSDPLSVLEAACR